MPPVDLAPLMNHPAWNPNSMTAAQRKQALDLWQDPASSEGDRAEMLKIMDQWQAAPAAPSAGARQVSSAGEMVAAIPGLAKKVAVDPFLRAGGYDPQTGTPAPPGEKPQTPQEWEARTLGMEQMTEKGASGVVGLMMGGPAGRAGYQGGAALANQVRPWLGRVADVLPAAGEAAAGYGTRQANIAMGNEQPGVVGDVASAVLPLGARAVLSRPVVERWPGAAGARHEMMADELRAQTANLQPATPAETLYRAVVQQGNPTIPVQDLRQTARNIIARELREGEHTRNTTVLGIAQDFDDLATQHQGNVPLDRLYERMQRIGERLRGVQRTDDQGTRELSSIYAGFHGALENASQSNIPGAQTLQQAIRASRQEHAVERLERIMGQGRGITEQTGTGATQVGGKKMLDEFDRLVADDTVFAGSFQPGELDEMRSLFQRANELPNLPPPPSWQRGSGKAAFGAAVGRGIGGMLGGPAGAEYGTMVGIAAPEMMSRLLMSGPGRAAMRAMLDGAELPPEALGVINQVSREVWGMKDSPTAGTPPARQPVVPRPF
jgi:hypothetical protein